MLSSKTIVAGPVCLTLTTELSSNLIERFDAPVHPDSFFDTEGVNSGVGGGAAETALALQRLGCPVRLVGKVGDDRFGEVVTETLQKINGELAHGIVVDLAMGTGVIVQAANSEADRQWRYIPGANNTFYASDIPRVDLQGADLFHFADPAAMRSVYRGEGGELVSILHRARREGLTTSLEFNLPDLTGPSGTVDWALVLENCLRDVDLFFADGVDLLHIFKTDVYDRLLKSSEGAFAEIITPDLLHELGSQVLAHRVKAVLIRLGAHGVYLRTASEKAWKKAGRALEGFGETWYDQELWAPEIVGFIPERTDAFVSGFLGSLLHGEDPGKALLMGSVVRASNGNGTWEEIQSQLDSGVATLPLEVRGEGWRKEGPYEA